MGEMYISSFSQKLYSKDLSEHTHQREQRANIPDP